MPGKRVHSSVYIQTAIFVRRVIGWYFESSVISKSLCSCA